MKQITTVPQLLRNVVENIHPETDTFLLFRGKSGYEGISYKAAFDKIDALAAWFLEQGIQKGDRLALICDNSPEWVLFDQALQNIGAVNLSIYPTLPDADIKYILNDSGAKMILCGNPFLFKKVLSIYDECPDLKEIITVFNDNRKSDKATLLTEVLFSFEQTVVLGKKLLDKHKSTIQDRYTSLEPEDICTLIYTSGTTGTPKGVMLTHNNLVMNAKTCLEQIDITANETFLSFLPLSHVFERTATYMICLTTGSKMAFAESLEALGKNMMEVKPTIMNVVPRLLEKIHDKAYKNGTDAGGLKSKIFLWALDTGKKYLNASARGYVNPFLAFQNRIADKLVFSKIKEKTGGNLKFMISGGAALPKNIGEFFGSLGIKVLEGFGLSETSPVISVTLLDRQVYGTVGRVIKGIEIGIQHPETKELITVQTHESYHPSFESAEGEIIVRGHCVMKGYYNKPKETAEVIDKDGWFHTGDIGKYENGFLKITDRIKNMIVNAYGKNIYPTPVENTYLKSIKIEQLFLVGDKREYITAIVVPNQELMRETFNLDDSFFEHPDYYIDNEAIIAWIKEDMNLYSKGLAKFEVVKNFIVKRTPFTVDSGELTPTLKTKRRIIETKYKEGIDSLYPTDLMVS